MTALPLIVGNWKMHHGPSEARTYLADLLPRLDGAGAACEVAVAPPFVSLPAAADALAGSSVSLAAQDASWEEEGPFTGEISARMLKDAGCRYVIVGHSERREHFGDTDRRVNRKARAVLFAGLGPILCVGEKADERAAGRAQEVVETQLTRALSGIKLREEDSLAVAYEPVWAIGTGRNASPSEAAEMHRSIRMGLEAAFGENEAGRIRILYGGSVTLDNAAAILATPGIDGALVGGASLDAESFAGICRCAPSRA